MFRLLSVAVLIAALSAVVNAQTGWCKNSPYIKLYDAKVIVNIAGTVESVDRFQPEGCKDEGVQLTLNTGTETIAVHLGPAWFILHQVLQIKTGEFIGVVGSRITYSGKPCVIARAIIAGGRQLILRQQGGAPVWDAWQVS